jgi:hypothetical protein
MAWVFSIRKVDRDSMSEGWPSKLFYIDGDKVYINTPYTANDWFIFTVIDIVTGWRRMGRLKGMYSICIYIYKLLADTFDCRCLQNLWWLSLWTVLGMYWIFRERKRGVYNMIQCSVIIISISITMNKVANTITAASISKPAITIIDSDT